MEGEEVLVELAVGDALVPMKVHIVLHEERRHKHAIEQVHDGNRQNS